MSGQAGLGLLPRNRFQHLDADCSHLTPYLSVLATVTIRTLLSERLQTSRIKTQSRFILGEKEIQMMEHPSVWEGCVCSKFGPRWVCLSLSGQTLNQRGETLPH